MSVCAAPTCSHQSFDGSSYYVDVDVDMSLLHQTNNIVLFCCNTSYTFLTP